MLTRRQKWISILSIYEHTYSMRQTFSWDIYPLDNTALYTALYETFTKSRLQNCLQYRHIDIKVYKLSQLHRIEPVLDAITLTIGA